MRIHIAKVACGELFLFRNESLYLQPAKNEFRYEEDAHRVNLKVNKVFIVCGRNSSYYSLQQQRKKHHGLKARKTSHSVLF